MSFRRQKYLEYRGGMYDYQYITGINLLLNVLQYILNIHIFGTKYFQFIRHGLQSVM